MNEQNLRALLAGELEALARATSLLYWVACGQAVVLTGPAAPYSLLARL